MNNKDKVIGTITISLITIFLIGSITFIIWLNAPRSKSSLSVSGKVTGILYTSNNKESIIYFNNGNFIKVNDVIKLDYFKDYEITYDIINTGKKVIKSIIEYK